MTLIFRTMVNICNAITKFAETDVCCDETTFSHIGYGEAYTGLLKRLEQTKTGVTRGMKTIFLFNFHQIISSLVMQSLNGLERRL